MSDTIYENSTVWIHGPQSGGGYSGRPNISMSLKVYKEVRNGNNLSIDVETSLNAMSSSSYFGYNLTISAKLDNGQAVELFSKPSSPSTWASGQYTSGRKTLQSNNPGTISTLYILFNSSSCPCHGTAGTVTVASFELKDLTPANFTVTFDLKGGIRTGGGELTQTISPGGNASAPSVSRTGYHLSGWDKALGPINSNETISAIWEADSHTVAYDLNGGSANGGSFNSFTKTYGSTVNITASKPVKVITGTFNPDAGYVPGHSTGQSVRKTGLAEFLGWNVYKYNSTTNKYDILLSSHPMQPSETYGFDLGDGKTASSTPAVKLVAQWGDATIYFPADPLLEDHRFLGWFYNDVNMSNYGSKMDIKSDRTLVARYYTSKIKIYDKSSGRWRPWLPECTTPSNVNMVYKRTSDGRWVKDGKVKKYNGTSWVDI